MNKRTIMIILAVVAAIVVVAPVSYFILTKKSKPPLLNTEYVGGTYNVTLSFYEGGYGEIDYTDETGSHSGRYFESQMRNCLDWIANDTPADATFLCWWDYGHMIKGYSQRNVVVRNPSHEWKQMVADQSSVTEFDPNEKLVDVACALTTNASSETKRIMEKFNASYAVVYKDDLFGKAHWMCRVAGLDPWDYYAQSGNWTLTEIGRQMMISRLMDNRDTDFTLVYEDSAIKVYRKD